MDLMKQSTTYQAMLKKYQDFSAPTVKITVDGVELIEKKQARVTQVMVELTNGYEASACSFDLQDEYEPSQSDFSTKGAVPSLQIGAKVEIQLGYITTEQVFSGLITQVDYCFEGEDMTPYLHVECMDAKCLLMKSQRLELCSEEKITDAVKTLLGQQPVSSYLSGKDVSLMQEDKQPLSLNMQSDYDFIVQQAQYVGCEFFIINGKAYFREEPALSSPIVTLSPDNGLVRVQVSLQGAELVEKVTVKGIDPTKDAEVSGSAKASGKFSSGSTAKKMISGTERVFFDSRVQSEAQANSRAKILMKGLTQRFAVLSAEVMGMPDLVPGRTVKLTGLSSVVDSSYYLTTVRHVYNSDGFTTLIEGRKSSL